jgi:uncharacterized secreted protein with C-terminal beta-propeller domain
MKKKFLIIIGFYLINLIFLDYAFSQSYTCNVSKLQIVKYGDRGQAVGELQKCLNNLGFQTKDGITNFFDEQTQQALKNFYKSFLGINVNGKNFGSRGLAWFRSNYSKVISNNQQEFLIKIVSKDELKKKLNQSINRNRLFDIGIEPIFYLPSPSNVGSAEFAISSKESPSRYSETNVQVKGIDEPDIIKNDGQQIYFVRDLDGIYFVPQSTNTNSILIKPKRGINIIKVFPVEEASFLTNIEHSEYSNSLLIDQENKILIVLNDQRVTAYQVTNPAKPEKLWSYDYAKGVNLLTARFYQKKLYLFLNTFLPIDNPCPLPVLSNNKENIELVCSDFYAPVKPIANENSYNIFILDPKSGNIEKKVSFLGSFYGSVVYVSPNNVYLTYSYQDDLKKYVLDFFYNWLNDILPSEVVVKINKLKDYDISDEGKIYEISNIINKYFLDVDKRNKVYQEIDKKIGDYLSRILKDIERTAIIKLDINNLEVKSSGYLPGNLLNQFSLDENDNYLRVAVTLGDQGFSFGPFWKRVTSSNAIYVLNDALKIIGSLENLGLTERIYSVRFYGNRGYLVTFRQIDPFYVIDLSNPKNPQLKGELKIPGYSSYLEELTEDLILGVGKEGQNVKVSLFDVSDPAKPLELSKEELQEYWTEVLDNHRAFLKDDQNKIFFLPSGENSYIFSYKDRKLNLIKQVNEQIKRAIYIDNYLYLISYNKIIVINEENWEEIKRLEI